MVAISLEGQLGIGEETTYGNAVGTTVSLPILSESITTDTGVIMPDEVRSDRARHTIVEGPIGVSGDLEMNVGPENGLGVLLKGALGSCSSTLSTTGVYEHVFSGASDIPSYTLEIDKGNMVNQYTGCKVDTLSFDCAGGEVASVTASMTGKEPSVKSSSGGVSYSNIRPFGWADAKVTIEGTIDGYVQSFTMELANNLIDDIHTLDEGRTIKVLPEGRREISGDMDISLQASDYYEWMLGGTVPSTESKFTSLLVEFTGGTFNQGSSYYLKFDMPRVKFTTDEVNLSGADEVVQSIHYEVEYDESTGKDLETTLVNSKSSY